MEPPYFRLTATLVLLFLFCFTGGSALAATNISDDIAQNARWTLQGSPYIVTKQINLNAHLTIDPGVTVRFATGAGFNGDDFPNSPQGSIQAVGTAEQPIVFTSNANTPLPGDWGRISLPRRTAGERTAFEHCIFEYGGGGQPGMIQVFGVSPTFRNCQIRHSASNGIVIQRGLNNPKPVIESCIFRKNRLAALTLDYSSTLASIRNNIFMEHSGYPVVTHANAVGALRLNTFVDNQPNAIQIVGGTLQTSQTISNSGIPLVVTGDLIGIGVGAELSIDPGVVMKFESGTGISTAAFQAGFGLLRATGEASNPILFTSNRDNPTPGDWGGISLLWDGPGLVSSRLEYCIVEYAGQSTQEAVLVDNASPTIRNCIIRNSSGDGIRSRGSSAKPVITQNNIYGNRRFGLNNESLVILAARDNWWGSASGPQTNNGNIDATNYLISPILLGFPRSPWLQYFPHFAAGAGWKSMIFLNNVEATDTTVTANFFNSSGNPQPVMIGSSVSSTFEFSLPAEASRVFEITSQQLTSGWIELLPKQRILASLVFQSLFGTQVIAAAGVLPSQVMREARIPILASVSASAFVGLAVANPQKEAIPVRFALFDNLGRKQAETSVNLPALGHSAVFVHQLFGQALEWNGYLKVFAEPGMILVPLKFDGSLVSTIAADKMK